LASSERPQPAYWSGFLFFGAMIGESIISGSHLHPMLQSGHSPCLISPNAAFDLRKTTDFAILDGLGVVRVGSHPYRRGWQSPAGR
jgi:hypothetical protein